jgi:hypothetical protein
MSYGQYAKKGVFAFFERLKLIDCSCVRSHLGIPYDYRKGIGGTAKSVANFKTS